MRCHHCGRGVADTVHTRSSYRVDYYVLYGGEVEPMTLPHSDAGAPPIIALKLLRPNEIVTCVNCYQQPGVREEREALFRPELGLGLAPGEAS